MTETELNIEENLAFGASTPDDSINFDHSEFEERVGSGFNEHGVRENYTEDGSLESVDVIFEAMEPGPPKRRNGVRITDEFLEKVGSKEYNSQPPHLKDHNDKDSWSKIGQVETSWYSERLNKFMVMTRTPNIEGSQNHQEAVARYTHDPPSIRDGSLGFGSNYTAIRNDDGEPEMKDGKFREFSTVNFPGGYDDGGVNRAFAEALDDTDFAEPEMEELQKVYDEYTSMLNMDERQMEMWEDHPCSDKGVDDGEERRDEFMMLSGQPMEEWDEQNLQIANRAIDFIGEQIEMDPEEPENGGPGTCPSRWAVNLLNRGYNPFDSFPSGNPQFHNTTVAVNEFDDPSDEDGDNGENSATGDFAVQTKTIQF